MKSASQTPRAKMARERKEMKQRQFERRFRARSILFGRFRKTCPLTDEERIFVRMVAEEAYAAYLHLFRTGKSRYGGGKKWIRVNRDRPAPLTFKKWYPMWYGSQKKRYHHYDIPRSVNVGNTQVP